MARPRLPRALPRITERQWQVAELVALGYQNGDIAEQLGLSVAGAKYHVSELLRRLDFGRREQISGWYRSERVVRGRAVDRSVFEPGPVPEQLRLEAEGIGWPAELLERARELRVNDEELARWLRHGPFAELDLPPSAEQFERWLRDRELLMFGTLRSRVATFGDNEALANLYERSSEAAGDSRLTLERSPHAFAQFRLLDNSHVQVLEDRGVALAAVARAYPAVVFEGERFRIETQLSFVVRDEARGHRYSRLISHMPRPADAWPVASMVFYYLRQNNEHGHAWAVAKGRTSASMAPHEPDRVPGFRAVVHHLSGEVRTPSHQAIRPATPRDLDACAALIKGRYGSAPFFIPVSGASLADRLERAGHVDAPHLWPCVYGWGDLYVYESGGRILACAGFWDAGKHMREVWVHTPSGKRTVVENAAVLDAGFEDGCEDAYLQLLHHLLRRANDSGRNRLSVWLDREPSVLASLQEHYAVVPEVRSLQCSLEDGQPPGEVDRPFVELAYW